MRIRWLLGIAIFGGVALGVSALEAAAGEAPARVAVPGGAYTNVTSPLLRHMLEKKDFFFVNVHIPYEGEIAKTDAHTPFDQVEKLIHQFPAKKDAKILLYCQSGRMSDIAARSLVQLGYTNIWHLKGGMVEWSREGYPLAHAVKK